MFVQFIFLWDLEFVVVDTILIYVCLMSLFPHINKMSNLANYSLQRFCAIPINNNIQFFCFCSKLPWISNFMQRRKQPIVIFEKAIGRTYCTDSSSISKFAVNFQLFLISIFLIFTALNKYYIYIFFSQIIIYHQHILKLVYVFTISNNRSRGFKRFLIIQTTVSPHNSKIFKSRFQLHKNHRFWGKKKEKKKKKRREQRASQIEMQACALCSVKRL